MILVTFSTGESRLEAVAEEEIWAWEELRGHQERNLRDVAQCFSCSICFQKEVSNRSTFENSVYKHDLLRLEAESLPARQQCWGGIVETKGAGGSQESWHLFSEEPHSAASRMMLLWGSWVFLLSEAAASAISPSPRMTSAPSCLRANADSPSVLMLASPSPLSPEVWEGPAERRKEEVNRLWSRGFPRQRLWWGVEEKHRYVKDGGVL